MEVLGWALLRVLLCLYWMRTPGDETIHALDVLNGPYALVVPTNICFSSLFCSSENFPSSQLLSPQITYLYA